MDVVRLGEEGTTDYVPDVLIEGYSSMIFTERFETPGDFQLKTPYIEETMALLPEDTLISTLQSKEVMIVEDHEIDVDQNDLRQLVVTGRTLDVFTEHRHVEAAYGKKRKMRKPYPPVGAAAVLLWQAFDNNSGKDVTRDEDFAWTLLDAIPNVAISDSVNFPGDARRWWLTEGPLAPQLRDILMADDLGIRIIRPQSSAQERISVVTALPDRGDIVRTNAQNVNQIRFDIYRGVDRSHTQTDRAVVSFNFRQGDIDNAKYFFSKKDFKTIAEVMSGAGGQDVYRNDGAVLLAGFKRRVMSYDAGEPEEAKNKPTDPGKNATNEENNQYETDLADWRVRQAAIDEEFRDDAEADALRELKRKRRTSLFTGDISPTAPFLYGRDFGLGDMVTLYGEFGQAEKMFVAEYIRTEDADGDRGYPGLTLP